MWPKKVQKKRVIQKLRKKKKVVEEETQVTAEEKLEEINLGTNPQKPRPISISLKLLEEEKLEQIQLLKEFKDIFAWEYKEMPGLDPSLVVDMLNVEPRTKLVA